MPYPASTQYTAIALGYKNKNYIADQVMPMVQVTEEKFEYIEYDLRDNFTPVDSKIGKTGLVNLIERNAKIKVGKTEDWGLGDLLTIQDIENAKKRKLDAKADSIETLCEIMALNREIRVASIVQDKVNYNNSIELETDIDTWLKSDSENVVEVIEAATNTPLVAPDRMVIGSRIWQLMRKNKSLLKTIYQNNKDGLGAVKIEDFKEFFSLNDVIIARAKQNTNNKGQQLNLSAVWGDVIAFHYNPASTRNLRHDLAWGMTAEFQKQQVKTFNKPELGSQGSVKVQVTHLYKEQILTKDAGVIIMPKQVVEV